MVEQQFYTILTKVGKAKIANSNVLNTKLNLTKFQVGDGGGAYYNPTEDQTKLKNKVWEGNINSIRVDKDNPSWIVIEVVIPSNEGGFMIREAGIVDDEGNLIAVGKYPETFKPHIDNGSSKDLFIRMILEVSNTQNVTLKVDPTIIMATKKDIEVLESRVKGLEDRVSEIETGLKDNTLTVFKTDALSTKLEGCSGGFVNIDKIEGRSLVNLFKGEDTRFDVDGKVFTSYNLLGANNLQNSILTNGTFTILNNSDRKIALDIYENKKWKRAIVVNPNGNQTFILTSTESGCVVYGFQVDGWTETNKNELLKTMILEGDWTNKPIPNYFEGIKSIGEPVYSNNIITVIKNSTGISWSTGVEIQDNTRCSCIDYMQVTKGTTIFRNKKCVLFLYDINKNYLGVEQVGNKTGVNHNETNYVVENGVTFIKVEFSPEYGNDSSKLTDAQIRAIQAYRIEILSRGSKNLSPFFNEWTDGVNPNSAYIYENKLIFKNTSEIMVTRGVLVNCKPNTAYSLSFEGDGYCSLGLYRNGASLDDIKLDFVPSGKYTITTSNSANQIKIVIGRKSILGKDISVYDVQLEEETTSTTYYPYKGDKTEILTTQPLRQWDSIDSNGVINRGSGQVVLNGSENWGLYDGSLNASSCCFYVEIPNKKIGEPEDKNVFSDKFTYTQKPWDVLTTQESIAGSNNKFIYIRILNDKIGAISSDSTGVRVQKIKTWLSQNPTTIVYQLATPLVENTTKILNLKSYDKLFVAAGSIQPEVSYSYAKNIGQRLGTIENIVKKTQDILIENSMRYMGEIYGAVDFNDYTATGIWALLNMSGSKNSPIGVAIDWAILTVTTTARGYMKQEIQGINVAGGTDVWTSVYRVRTERDWGEWIRVTNSKSSVNTGPMYADLNVLNNPNYKEAYVMDISPENAKAIGLPNIWYHIQYFMHGNINGHGTQVAWPFYGTIDTKAMYRSSLDKTWSSWKTIMTSDIIQYGSNEPTTSSLPLGGVYIKI